MSTFNLYNLTKQDIPRGAECLRDAFSHDPLWAEVFKNTPNKNEVLLNFFTCPLLHGFRYGKACSTSSDVNAVAVWVPGKYASMNLWQMLCSGSLKYGSKIGREAFRNMGGIYNQLITDRKRHMKNKDYIYLSIIGVSLALQGNGHGSILLEAIKDECKQSNQYLYLETETEGNVQYYEKNGFSIVNKITLDKLGLPMWEMVYKP